jgi:hypothetical protein
MKFIRILVYCFDGMERDLGIPAGCGGEVLLPVHI